MCKLRLLAEEENGRTLLNVANKLKEREWVGVLLGNWSHLNINLRMRKKGASG